MERDACDGRGARLSRPITGLPGWLTALLHHAYCSRPGVTTASHGERRPGEVNSGEHAIADVA